MAAPVIVGATAAASLFEKISAVTGSVPDLLQGIGAVAEWAKGQEGLSYKEHLFNIGEISSTSAGNGGLKSAGVGPVKSGSSGATTTAGNGGPKSAGVGPRTSESSGPPSINREKLFDMTSGVEPVKRFPLLTVIAKLDDESQSALKAAKYIAQAFKAVFPALWRIPVDELIPDQNEAVAQFSVELVGMPRSLGYTVLTGVKGFDTSIGSQTSIEFSGTTWQGHGYVLSFNGFINVIGGGYEEFSGKILITPGYEDPLIGLTCRMPRKGSYLTWEPKNGYVIELSASKMIP